MLAIAFPPPANDRDVNHWAFVISHFVPDEVYLLGTPRDGVENYLGLRDAKLIATCDSLPEIPLVAFAPRSGRTVTGVVPLAAFEPPDDCILLFGPDHDQLDARLLGSRVPDLAVYIETDTQHEMYSHVAAALALYACKYG